MTLQKSRDDKLRACTGGGGKSVGRGSEYLEGILGDDKGGGGSSLLIRREICTVPPGITFRSTIFPFFLSSLLGSL